MWHCMYKFPFDYYALVDENGKTLSTAFPENYYVLLQKKSDTDEIKKMRYEGCPRWNYS